VKDSDPQNWGNGILWPILARAIAKVIVVCLYDNNDEEKGDLCAMMIYGHDDVVPLPRTSKVIKLPPLAYVAIRTAPDHPEHASFVEVTLDRYREAGIQNKNISRWLPPLHVLPMPPAVHPGARPGPAPAPNASASASIAAAIDHQQSPAESDEV